MPRKGIDYSDAFLFQLVFFLLFDPSLDSPDVISFNDTFMNLLEFHNR